MKKLTKYALLLAALALGFASCKTDVDTKYVEQTVTKEVPTDMTKEAATAVYHWKANVSGAGYTLYPSASDGVKFVVADAYKEEVGETSSYTNCSEKEIEVKEVPAGTKLSAIAKNLTGFHAIGVATS